MYALPNGTALEGIATTVSTVVATIEGMELDTSSPPNGAPFNSQGYVPSTAGSLYSPSGSKSSLISKIHLLNTSGSVAQTVSLFIGGTAASNQIATFSIPAGGWASYNGAGEDWQVYTSAGVPMASAGLITASSYITNTVSVPATTITNITSLSLSPGTWLILGAATFHLTTATLGHMDLFLGPTSASKTSAYCAETISIGNIAGGVEECSFDLATVKTFTTTTTVYLEAYSSEATTAENNSIEQTIGNVTGILAIKIG